MPLSVEPGESVAPIDLRVGIVLSKLALIVEEVGEVVSAVRHMGQDQDNTGEELADICIRVFDLAVALDINLEQEIVNKMSVNEKRPMLHGKMA